MVNDWVREFSGRVLSLSWMLFEYQATVVAAMTFILLIMVSLFVRLAGKIAIRGHVPTFLAL